MIFYQVFASLENNHYFLPGYCLLEAEGTFTGDVYLLSRELVPLKVKAHKMSSEIFTGFFKAAYFFFACVIFITELNLL